jgi:predicted nucleic acid-binding protein
MKKSYVLDACGLIAFLSDEEGSGKVESILKKAEKHEYVVYMHQINVFEVYYGIYREDGREKADEVYENILNLPVTIIEKLDATVFREAGRLKAVYKISLADSIALAESKIRKAPIVTCDHHEFDVIEKNKELKFYWIR